LTADSDLYIVISDFRLQKVYENGLISVRNKWNILKLSILLKSEITLIIRDLKKGWSAVIRIILIQLCIYVLIYVFTNIYAYMHIHIYIYIYAYIHIHIRISYENIYVYINIYIRLYICIYAVYVFHIFMRVYI
jgi:hypothetical protein